MPLGALMLDLAGPVLEAGERELLAHPGVGGVILFSRNYESGEQLRALVDEVHRVREPPLLVAVDQEGGRVQRFREGFTRLPPPARLGERYDRDPQEALRLARTCGWLMASELRAVGVDLSFAPVLDLRRQRAGVIGDRAFHRDPDAVADLAGAWVHGMRDAGMSAVGKHFPGHGTVAGDSHEMLPVDERPLVTLRLEDLLPFERLIGRGLPGLMIAHVVYPEVDRQPAGFSRAWIRNVLRGELGFGGAVFSDDLAMAGAAAAGDPPARARAALAAGCDMVLACNDRPAAEAILEALARAQWRADAVALARLARMHGRAPAPGAPPGSDAHAQAARAVAALEPEPELDLDEDESV